MINCNFTRNINQFWQCEHCGWVYPRKADKPPIRNCPKQNGNHVPPTHRESVLHHYTAAQMTDLPKAEIERRLDVCEACEEYAGLACIKAGASCRKTQNWRDKVLIGNCERHK